MQPYVLPRIPLRQMRALQVFLNSAPAAFYRRQYEILSYGQPDVFGVIDTQLNLLSESKIGQRTLAYLVLQVVDYTLKFCPDYSEYRHIPRLKFDGLAAFCAVAPKTPEDLLKLETVNLIVRTRENNPYLWHFIEMYLVELPGDMINRVRLVTSLYLLLDRQMDLNWRKTQPVMS